MAKGGHKKSHTSKSETKKQLEVLENKKKVAVDDTEDMNSGFGEYMRSGEGCIFNASKYNMHLRFPLFSSRFPIKSTF